MAGTRSLPSFAVDFDPCLLAVAPNEFEDLDVYMLCALDKA
jgi:hypothetical protein